MKTTLLIYWNKLRKRLWFRPLIFCFIAVTIALLAKLADGTFLDEIVPEIKEGSVTWLLDTMASSMLVISIFAVTSMLSAFTAAQSSATPRSFKLIIADDVSQNALSVFISAFIFGIVASVAINNGYFGPAGRFTLFIFALAFFALIILVFLRWVDRISRLGRLEQTIHKIEEAAAEVIRFYLDYPTLKCMPLDDTNAPKTAVFSLETGYIQNINFERLQAFAEKMEAQIRVKAITGNFVTPGEALVYIDVPKPIDRDEVTEAVNKGFAIGKTRDFEADPRFGLIALSEIASRALSPGINDPGTAIQIIASHQRMFYLWDEHPKPSEDEPKYDRIQVPKLDLDDLFEDAFRAISRDGAKNIEVMIKMQKAFTALHLMDNEAMKKAALKYSELTFKR
ncbi:MAG TPA: DUF2254 domain-containing protein, partial [Cryomorphaceae bacterium]|nr:DUF2254 domain-containing protein [Cryomorphaceae bacterium]